MARDDASLVLAPRGGSRARRRVLRRPRYELRLVRAGAAGATVVVRSRHRFRLLAHWSRRLDADHVALLTGCELVVVDTRREGTPPPRVALVRAAGAAENSGRRAA